MVSRWPTRIVVLVTSAFGGIGGIETFNRTLLHALDQLASRHGWNVQVFSLLDTDDARGADSYLPSGLSEVRGFSGNRIEFSWFACRASRSADVVIIGHANLLPLAQLMNGSFKCLMAYGIEVWKELPQLQRRNARRMDRILCISAHTKREMMRRTGMAEDRFRLFPPTLDPVYAEDGNVKVGRKVLGLPEGPMLLTVSRLAPSERYKNVHTVIECLPAVLEQVPEAFYVIVGDGTERKVLRDLAHGMGLRDKVFLPGSVPQELLSSYYAACDVFVLPSVKEGFGIVFLEAMYHSKACIGASAGGVPEVVHDGTTGLLVDDSDILPCLRQAILRLLTDQALRKSMEEQGRSELESKFSFAQFCDRLEQILYPAGALASYHAQIS
jgi:phosphatidyl-myo-inositol dimannoside synthase